MFVRGQRVSILPGLTIQGIIAYDVIPGSVTSARFASFVREYVVSAKSILCYVHEKLICIQIPLTNPWPGPRSVLILDNCNIHHSEELRHLVEDEARKSLSS
jgi:hypothetical protein